MTEKEKAAFLIDFGNRVKVLRIQQNMTLEELARRIGYTTDNARSSMQKIEAGKSDPPASRIRALAVALNVSVGVLMGWDEFDNQFDPDTVSKQCNVFETIKEQFGSTARDAFLQYTQLDQDDQGEIRGEMKQMLKAAKYSTQDGSSEGKAM